MLKKTKTTQKATLVKAAHYDYRATIYTGSELKPYAGRPGALDHLLLPSRTGNTIHFRSLASIQTVHSERMPASAV